MLNETFCCHVTGKKQMHPKQNKNKRALTNLEEELAPMSPHVSEDSTASGLQSLYLHFFHAKVISLFISNYFVLGQRNKLPPQSLEHSVSSTMNRHLYKVEQFPTGKVPTEKALLQRTLESEPSSWLGQSQGQDPTSKNAD